MPASDTSDASFLNHKDLAPKWPRLVDDAIDVYSKLHDKFWGKSMAIDEQEWRDSHEGRAMMDGDDDDDPESEIGPGCYPLELPMCPRCKRLWVRKDYIRLYDFCEQWYERVTGDNSRVDKKAPSVVITGQSGVGKTCWILYAIRRRLGERKPFIWYNWGRFNLFVEEGVFRKGLQDNQIYTFDPLMWTFVDAGLAVSPTGIPPHLVYRETSFFNIYPTPPPSSLWKCMTKTTHCAIAIMNPWTREEMSKAAVVHEFSEDQRDLVQERFDTYGPIPRICIHPVRIPGSFTWDDDCYTAALACTLTIENLCEFVYGASDFDMTDERLGRLFILRRENVDEVQEATLDPVSHVVETRLNEEIDALRWNEQISLYRSWTTMPVARRIAGFVFGSLARSRLQQGVTLKLVPMPKRPPTVQGGKSVQWGPMSNPGDPSLAASSPVSIYFPPNETVEFEGRPTAAFNLEPNRLYVPKSTKDRVPLDSFIFSSGHFYIFQIATASLYRCDKSESVYGINEGIKEFFSGQVLRALPPKRRWRLVFVVPPGKRIVGQSKSTVERFLMGVTLFSAELDVRT